MEEACGTGKHVDVCEAVEQCLPIKRASQHYTYTTHENNALSRTMPRRRRPNAPLVPIYETPVLIGQVAYSNRGATLELFSLQQHTYLTVRSITDLMCAGIHRSNYVVSS